MQLFPIAFLGRRCGRRPPSWDLRCEVFGAVAGVAKVNHRMIVPKKHASVPQLRHSLELVLADHAMQQSFELRGAAGEPTMRAIMRAIMRLNGKLLDYCIEELPEVNNPGELVSMIYEGEHFGELGHPYPHSLCDLLTSNRRTLLG